MDDNDCDMVRFLPLILYRGRTPVATLPGNIIDIYRQVNGCWIYRDGERFFCEFNDAV